MNRNIVVLVVGLGMIMGSTANAEPRSEKTQITNMRPYTDGAYFVTLATANMTSGGPCNRTYKVQSDAAGAKSVIASLLTAYALGEDIQIEVPTATGCVGFGTPIQSVFMAPAL